MPFRDKVERLVVRVHNWSNRQRLGRFTYKLLAGVAIAMGVFLLFNVCFPCRVRVDYAQIVTASDGTVMTAFLTRDDKWRMMTELDEITPDMQKAIVFKEDKYFYQHPGVNPAAIARALFNNIKTGTRTSGASTITMQVARMLQPKERTYGNKMLEMFRALQLDMLYSKAEILQLYLNLVPYGGNIEGVKAASVLYLGKNPEVLSLAELTALSIIPNRPTSLRPGINNDIITQERNKWLERFREAGLFSDETIDDAINEPFNAIRTEVPKMARHFSTRMRLTHPGIPIIKTTIQPEVQDKCEQLLQEYVKTLWTYNIQNGACIVINNHTHQIDAYVGSADFFNTVDGGQVDGVRSVRSPGSTLKPLLYALAFDAGLYTPQAAIADVPVNYSGYAPENYDETYHGNVTIAHALANSLNVPAVRVLHELGMEQYIQALTASGFNTIAEQKKDLGLSLALGGCGVTLEELTRLYAAFATSGTQHHLAYLQEDKDTSTVKICSPEAAFMITEILTQLTRPDLPVYYQNARNVPTVAWKTGTSYGRRDAWSIGYNSDYTVGVWIGNFSGTGIPELTGAQVATPLLFNLFYALNTKTDGTWNRMPENVQFRYVCDITGKIPSAQCQNQVMDYFIPGKSPNDTCRHLIPVQVDAHAKESYCTTCLPETGYKTVWYENISPELISWRIENHIPFEKIPPHNSKCERVFTENAPVITSPLSQMEYLLEKEDPQKIMLQANVAADVEKVFWYVNNKLLTSAKAGEAVFYVPTEGKTVVSCSDDKGRNAKTTFTVTFF